MTTVAEIKERLSKATEAAKPPYIVFPYYHLSVCTEEFPKVGLCNMVDTQPFFTPEMQAAVAELFAQAPTDIAYLLKTLEAGQEVIRHLEEFKKYASHRPGEEIGFFRFKAQHARDIGKAHADTAVWDTVADALEALQTYQNTYVSETEGDK